MAFSIVTFSDEEKSSFFHNPPSGDLTLSNSYLIVILPAGPFVLRMSAYEKEIRSVTKNLKISLCVRKRYLSISLILSFPLSSRRNDN